MTIPTVTECSKPLEPVERDTFGDVPAPRPAASAEPVRRRTGAA